MKYEELPYLLRRPGLTIRGLDAIRVFAAAGGAYHGYQALAIIVHQDPVRYPFPAYQVFSFLSYALVFTLANFFRIEIARVRDRIPKPPTPADAERRRRSKRVNEHVKLLSSFISNIGSATLLGAIVMPLLVRRSDLATPFWIPALFSLGCHLAAHGILLNWKSEE